MLNNDLRWAAYIAIAIDYGSDSGSIVNNHIWEINNAIYALIQVFPVPMMAMMPGILPTTTFIT
jgi:hypothetical protein